MKKLLKTTLLLAGLSFLSVTVNAQTGQIVFENTSHNFGDNIPEKGGDITHRFVFTNTGNAPVTIQNVQTSCGCTSPAWIKEPVAPGKQGYVDATYRPNGRPGAFSKNVIVKSNGETKQISLSIAGTVVKAPLSPEEEFPIVSNGIRLSDKVFAFARVAIDTKEENASVIKVYNSGNVPVEVSLGNVPKYLKIDIAPVRLEPKQKGEIKASFIASSKNKYGTNIAKLNLLVNKKEVESLTSTVTIVPSTAAVAKNDQRPVLRFINNNYTFSNIKQGAVVSQDFKFTNTGQGDLQIVATNVVNEQGKNIKITAPAKPIKPGEQGVVKVVLNTKQLEGTQDFNIELITNVTANPIAKITLRGNIIK